MIEIVGSICAALMPLFNIPLMARIFRRRSSADISLFWAVGVWLCILGMLPASLVSSDRVLKVFGVVNTFFFTGVLACVLYFHPSVRNRKGADRRP